MEYIYNIMTKRAPVFDVQWFSNYEKNQIKAARFFLLVLL